MVLLLGEKRKSKTDRPTDRPKTGGTRKFLSNKKKVAMEKWKNGKTNIKRENESQ